MNKTAPTHGRTVSAPPVPFLRRVRIRNYKSLAYCDVELGALTILVGRNGAGKSNFLDALRFITDALRMTLDQATQARGGIDLLRRRAWPLQFSLKFDLDLGEDRRALYEFEAAPFGDPPGRLSRLRERLEIQGADEEVVAFYKVSRDRLDDSSERIMPPVARGRLYLAIAAGLPEFRSVYDALLMTGFYNFNLESIRVPQRPDTGEILFRDGRNLASVVGRIDSEHPEIKQWLRDYLAIIVPGIMDINRAPLGSYETLEFRQSVPGSKSESPYWSFDASSMSDGTLRALGALVAVAQPGADGDSLRLVGIEEPETALHPAASAVLMDALREATTHTQVIVTTHSADLLDLVNPDIDRLLVAEMREGDTVIATVNRASREAIKERLYPAGELLRMDQFQPDFDDLQRQQNAPEPLGQPG